MKSGETGSIFSEQENIDLLIAELQKSLETEREKTNHLQSEVNWLKEQLATLNRGTYGKKSEAWESQEQLKLPLNEAELEAAIESHNNPESSTDEDIVTEVTGHTRKARGHRKPLPKNLPREVVKVELPESEQVSKDGIQLKLIGWRISEKLKYIPAVLSVVEIHRAIYGVDNGDYEKSAPPIPSVIPKGIATEELLAAIIASKYSNGLPLYRLEEIFQGQGVELSRGTMGRWMVQVAQALMPIRNVLSDRLLSSHAIACDETAMQVLKELGRDPEQKSWMIVRSNPCEEKKVVLFDYAVHRNGEKLKDLFADYQGKLLCDGLDIYNAIESETLIRFGCHMHARRRFESAATDGAKSGKTIASKVMEIYKCLYDIEEKIKGKPPDEITKLRREFALPLIEQIKLICETHRDKVPDKSKLGMAIKYFANEYEYLIKYIDDGRMAPDNGFIERVIRKFAIGRRNWLFADTPGGADASSLLYSLAITAKLNGVNFYEALVEMLKQVPTATTIEEFEKIADLILSPKKTTVTEA